MPGRWLAATWQKLLCLGVLAALVLPMFTRRKSASTHDEPAFAAALRVWAKVLMLANPSPRAAKRFLNRVRYLAMLERPASAEQPGWRRWLTHRLSSTATRLRQIFREPAAPQATVPPESKRNSKPAGQTLEAPPAVPSGSNGQVADHIPDALLVALSVIYEAVPDALDSTDKLKAYVENGNGNVSAARPECANWIPQAWSTINSEVSQLTTDQVDKYRQRFVDLSAGFLSQ